MRRMYSENQVKEIVNQGIESGEIELPPDVEQAQSGTIASGSVLGLNSSGKVVKGIVSGGIKLYKHAITINNGSYDQTFNVIALQGQTATSVSDLAQLTILFAPSLSDVVKIDNGGQYYRFVKYQDQGNALVPTTTNIVNFISDQVTEL